MIFLFSKGKLRRQKRQFQIKNSITILRPKIAQQHVFNYILFYEENNNSK